MHLHGKGVPTLAVTVATRYIHSHAAILHRDDFEHTVQLARGSDQTTGLGCDSIFRGLKLLVWSSQVLLYSS